MQWLKKNRSTVMFRGSRSWGRGPSRSGGQEEDANFNSRNDLRAMQSSEYRQNSKENSKILSQRAMRFYGPPDTSRNSDSYSRSSTGYQNRYNANRNNSNNMNTNHRPKNNNFSNYSHKNTSFNPNNQRNLVNKKKNVLLANENNINKNLKTKNTGLPENRWFKVNIYKGKLFNREFVLKSLKTLCENNQFIVYQYHEIGNNSAFFVQGEDTARTLFECNSKIVTSNGERIKLQIVQVTEPLSSPITKELSIKIQELVDNNLDQSSLKLELDYLSRNPIFLIDEIYISLNKPIVISTICEALKSKSETVQHLSLRGNSLYTISAIKKLLSCLPNLKKLDLSDNNLLSLNELSHLKDLCGSITEINLRGNPLNDKPSEDNDYIKYVRSYLSHIIILDSVEHPPPILFDFNESLVETKLPESNNEFFIDSSIKDSVIKFLDQYIYIYDSDDRQPLLEAYDDNASFSLSLFKSTGASNRQQQNENSSYLSLSQNYTIMNMRDTSKTKNKKVDIIYAISKFPKTKHISESIRLQCLFKDGCFVMVTFMGVFEETNSGKKRDFQRTFMLKYSDEMTSAVIMNDMLMVSNLIIDDEKSHTVLIKELSKATGLAQRYAHDCLKQNHWDYHQALESFTEMKESNSLPDSVFM